MAEDIARSDDARGALCTRSTVRAVLGAQVLVGPTELAVVVRDGNVLGVLAPGRYVLDPRTLPFLAAAAQSGSTSVGDVLFSTTTPVPGVRVGGPLGVVRDGASGQAVSPNLTGQATIRLVDPVRAAVSALGGPGLDLDQTLRGYVQYGLMEATRGVVVNAAQSERLAALFGNSGVGLADLVRSAAAPSLANLGVEIVTLDDFSLTLSDEDSRQLGLAVPESEPQDAVYEMLWDCKFCGEKKLLGITHRHCPSCGAPQNAGARYFPSDAEKVPAKQHEYFGKDVLCGSCGEANSKNSKHCGGCGAPLDGAKSAATKEDVVAGEPRVATPPARPRTKSRAGSTVKLVVVGLALVVALVVFGVFWKREAAFVVAGHDWKREIAVQRYGPVSDSAWCDQAPSGARGVSKRREVRSQRQVPDGQNCQMRKVDRGNGSFTEHEECTPKYRDEPVYDERCYYSVDWWTTVRTASASGTAVTDVPKWPDTLLARAGTCEGCEREGSRTETYDVLVKEKSGQETSCPFDQTKWTSFADGAGVKGAVRTIGGLDCATLAPQ